MEDALARIHREYREECIRNGTYRPFTEAELAKEIDRWKAKCKEVNMKAKRRKNPPKGTAD
jgi:hypothetical protein